MRVGIGLQIGGQHKKIGGEKLQITEASGEAFPVWNTISGSDKVSLLSIQGKTVQQATPIPDTPAEFQSVGDSGLILTVASSRTGGEMQTFNFGNIVLRSLSNGIKDEIIYENGIWKHIQRVFAYHVTGREGSSGGAITNGRVTGWISVPSKTATQYIESNRFVRDVSISTPNPQIGRITLHKGGGFIYVGLSLDSVESGGFLQWFIDHPTTFLYPIDNPVETILDLPAISTYAGETWFMTNQITIKPHMSASVIVEKKVKPAGAPLAWWDVVGRTNTDADREIIMDKTGKGYDLNLYGFGYIQGSGFDNGVLECDGVDDYLVAHLPERERNNKTLFLMMGGMSPSSLSCYCFYDNAGIGEFLEVGSDGRGFFQATPSGTSYINFGPVTLDFSLQNIFCISREGNLAKAFINETKTGEKTDYTDLGWKNELSIGRRGAVYKPFNFIAAILYDRILSDQEIQQTINFLQQKYGI